MLSYMLGAVAEIVRGRRLPLVTWRRLDGLVGGAGRGLRLFGWLCGMRG